MGKYKGYIEVIMASCRGSNCQFLTGVWFVRDTHLLLSTNPDPFLCYVHSSSEFRV